MLNKIPFRRIRWPGWVVLIIMVYLFVCGTTQLKSLWFFDFIDADRESTEFKIVTENTDTYTISIETPEIEDDVLNKSVIKWINNEKEQFFTSVKENKSELGEGYRAHLFIQTDMRESTAGTYSLIINSYQLVNSFQGVQDVKTFTIDRIEDRILKFSDVVKSSENATAEIRRQIQENNTINLSDEKINRVLEDPELWNWTIDNHSLSLYFTAVNGRHFQIEIPIEVIRPYLNEKVANSLGNSENKTNNHAAEELENKYVALTFDDGPDSKVTPRILKILKDHDVQATFFMLGSQAEKFPSLAKKVSDAGHEIGNHTNLHKDLTKLEKSQLLEEVLISRQKIQEATGQTPSILRPPYGAVNQQVVETARVNGSSIVLWSVDSLDWKNKNAVDINKVVQKEIRPGSIILLHDVHSTTADSLPKLLSTLEKEGYQFLTVSQLRATQEQVNAGLY
jgi:peptidoglycan-N-acetylglucosamine deacetylase